MAAANSSGPFRYMRGRGNIRAQARPPGSAISASQDIPKGFSLWRARARRGICGSIRPSHHWAALPLNLFMAASLPAFPVPDSLYHFLCSFALLRSVAMGAERCVLRDLFPTTYALFSCATLPVVNRIAVHKERENQEQKDEQYNNQTQECNLHYDYDRCAIHDLLLQLPKLFRGLKEKLTTASRFL